MYRISFLRVLLSAILLCLACVGTPAARADSSTSVTPAFQSQLVELFSKHHCDEIIRLTNAEKVRALRPNVMALVAYCDPPWGDAEKIFEMAEALSPTGDLILVLHAKYRTKKDRASAAPIWNKVLLNARNRAFREMAEEYFSGEAVAERPISLSPVTVFGDVTVGGGQESSPRPEELSYLPTHGSGAVFTAGDFSWRRWFYWGSVATNYAILYNDYFSESQYDLMRQSLDIPIALHLSSSKDIVFKPLTDFSMIGGSLYEAQYGISVSGVVYKDTYKQSVEGAVFQDNYYIDTIQTLGAAHYRFQYSWEFFPPLTDLAALLRVEHASAGTASVFNNIPGYFPFSHTDVGVEFKAERNFHGLIFGVAPSFGYRFDSQETIFPLNTTGEIVAKRRVDKTIAVQPSVTIPIAPATQIYAWYRFERDISNFGHLDYVNWNLTDNVVGLALKASFSSY